MSPQYNNALPLLLHSVNRSHLHFFVQCIMYCNPMGLAQSVIICFELLITRTFFDLFY